MRSALFCGAVLRAIVARRMAASLSRKKVMIEFEALSLTPVEIVSFLLIIGNDLSE